MTESTYENIDNPYDGNLERVGETEGLFSEVQASSESGIINSPTQVSQNVLSGDTIDDLWITSFIKSRNYQPKSQGFMLRGGDGYIEANKLFIGSGGIIGGSLDIPDTTTANSFHVDASGNTWWGATTLVAANAKVLNTGVATFTGATISGAITITSGSGIANLSDAGALATEDTADFATQVSGIEKPENNATVGANWSVNLTNIPATLGSQSASGLYLSSTYLGYWETVSLGNSTTQFDITNTAGNTYRYTYDGTGTDPLVTTYCRVGTEVVINAQNFTAANNGTFTVTAVNTNYFEVTNASGVVESNKTIGTGYIKSNNWNSYIDDNGNFFFRGDGTSSIDWNITTASTLTIKGKLIAGTGSSIDGSYLSGSITSGVLNVADRGWTQTCVFSSTDYNTVAWAGGTFTASDGTAYTIDADTTDARLTAASLTSPMNALTYIYLDIAVSTTKYQCTYIAATANGAGKVLIAVANPNTDATSDATFQVFGGAGGVTMLVDNIAANSASTNEFISNTAQIANAIITNAKISDLAVSKLTAGTITSKSIVLAVNDGDGDVEMRAGIATGDFANAGAANGFILGIDDSDSNKSKFYFGSPTEYIKFDGSNVSITAPLNVDLSFVAGESLTAGNAVGLYGDITETTNDVAVNQSTYVSREEPNTNYDDMGIEIDGGAAASEFQDGLVSYTGMPTIPSATGLTILTIKVKFHFYHTVGSIAASPEIHVNTASFNEATATWNTKPAREVGNIGDIDASANNSWTDSGWLTISSAQYNNIKTNGITIHDEASDPYIGLNYRDEDGPNPPYVDVEFNYKIQDGRIYKVNATTAEYTNSFMGVAQSTVAEDASVMVRIEGKDSNQTGLTAYSVYYLSDTDGTISTTPGTKNKIVGRALSTTTLQVKYDLEQVA